MAEFGGEPRNFRDKFWYLATTNTKIASGRETAAGVQKSLEFSMAKSAYRLST